MPIGSTMTMKKLFLCMCVVVLAGCTGTPREVRLTDLRTTINQRDERRLPLDFAKIQMALFKHEKARSEEHTSELQSLMRISYAIFCLNNKKNYTQKTTQ